MQKVNRKIVTVLIGLAGAVSIGGTAAWTGATPGQTPAGVTQLADMHWKPPNLEPVVPGPLL